MFATLAGFLSAVVFFTSDLLFVAAATLDASSLPPPLLTAPTIKMTTTTRAAGASRVQTDHFRLGRSNSSGSVGGGFMRAILSDRVTVSDSNSGFGCKYCVELQI